MAPPADSAGGGREGGRFRPGQSGNPAGRAAGSRNRTTQLCADLLSDDAGAIMSKAIEQAKAGDAVCLRLCIERLIPMRAARDRAVTVDVSAASDAAGLVVAAAEVIRGAAAGEMTLSEAKEFMALIEGQRKILETGELTIRLQLLEQRLVAAPAGGVGGCAVRASVADDPEFGARVRRLVVEGVKP